MISEVFCQRAEALLALFDDILGFLALGDVADDSEHQALAVLDVVAQAYGAERYLDRDFLSVLAHCGQIQYNVEVDVGSVARIPVARHTCLALRLEAFRDDNGPTVVACLEEEYPKILVAAAFHRTILPLLASTTTTASLTLSRS